MMTVMKNIMIVSVLIMLQMQSVYCAMELESDRSASLALFVRVHEQFCSSDDKLMDSLRFLKYKICLHKGLNQRCTESIEALKNQNSEVRSFLHFREVLYAAVFKVLCARRTEHTNRQKLFDSLSQLCLDRCSSDRADSETEGVVLAQIVCCKSVQDAWENVFKCFQNNAILDGVQKQYIASLLANYADVKEFSALSARELETCNNNLSSYHQSIERSEVAMKQYRNELAQLWRREKPYDSALVLVQNILDKEARKVTLTLLGGGGIVALGLASGVVGIVAWMLQGYSE